MNNLRILSGLLIVALLIPASARAQTRDPEDQYLRVFDVIQQADALRAGGQAGAALTKYRQARKMLIDFKTDNPDWNVTAVNFRLNYLTDQIASLSSSSSPSAGPGGGGGGSDSLQVKLLEGGAEPRKALRLHPKAGDTQSVVMSMKMAMGMKAGEMESPAMKMPLMKMTMDSTVKSVSPNGDINWEMVVSDVSVADDPEATPQVAEAMKSSLAGLKGLSGASTMSNRGFRKAIDMKLPPGANPQMRQMMDQWKDTFSKMAAPLPEEPIGIGGKWQARMPIKSEGMTLDQVVTYQLLSMEGDTLNTTNYIVQTAANQRIQSPVMPTMKVDLTKMTGIGSGNTTYDLTKVVPPEGAIDFHSELSMALSAGGQKQAMEMKIDLNLQIGSK
jgi:hypothetical protein